MKTSLSLAGSLLAALVADAALSRPELEKKLQDLAKAPPPTKLAPGAMCYEAAASFDRIEYVCPTCQEKTLYKAEGAWAVQESLQQADAYRRLAKQLQELGLVCKLDESAFCKKCGKGQAKKCFVLEVQCQGESALHRTELREPGELLMLLEFLQGKTKHVGATGGERPLKDFLPRIQELLGLAGAKKPEEKKP